MTKKFTKNISYTTCPSSCHIIYTYTGVKFSGSWWELGIPHLLLELPHPTYRLPHISHAGSHTYFQAPTRLLPDRLNSECVASASQLKTWKITLLH